MLGRLSIFGLILTSLNSSVSSINNWVLVIKADPIFGVGKFKESSVIPYIYMPPFFIGGVRMLPSS